MYGWHGRIGHIAPSRGDSLVYEFYRVSPPGTYFLNTTGTIRNIDKKNISLQLTRIEEAAHDLAGEKVDVIIIGGDPLFTSQGYGSDRKLCEKLEGELGIPVTTTLSAAVDGLKALGAKNIVIASPYPEVHNRPTAEFLMAAGFKVAGIAGLDLTHNATIGQLPEHAFYRLAKEACKAREGVEGIYGPCSRWPTLGCVDLLEKETGAVVVTSSVATIWKTLDLLSIRHEICGYGSLLKRLSAGA